MGRLEGKVRPDPDEIEDWRRLEAAELRASIATTPELIEPRIHDPKSTSVPPMRTLSAKTAVRWRDPSLNRGATASERRAAAVESYSSTGTR